MNYVSDNHLLQAKAFAWEFWANGWKGQLLGLVGTIGFASLVYAAIGGASEVQFQGTQAGAAMHFGFYWAALICIGAPIALAWGRPRRRFSLPASNVLIVACPMVCSTATMFVLYAATAVALNTIFDAGWPILGPGLLAALLIAWLQAVLWSTSNSLGLQATCCLLSFVAVLVGISRWELTADLTEGYFLAEFNMSGLIAFIISAIIAMSVGIIGFGRTRRGDEIDVQCIVDWFGRLWPRAARPRPFSSPATAQFWAEWTERGYVMPAGVVLFAIVVLSIVSFAPVADVTELVGGTSALLFMPAVVVGLYIGSRSETGEFGNFGGTRPLGDQQFARVILANYSASLFSSAVLWFAFLSAVLVIIACRGSLAPLEELTEPTGPLGLACIAILSLGALWGVMGLTVSVVVASRTVGKILTPLLLLAIALTIVVPRLALSPATRDAVLRVSFNAFLVAAVASTIAAFAFGVKKRLVSLATIALAIVIVGAMAFAAYQLKPIGGVTFLPIFGMCCLTPLPLATLPLAVWWNRHR